MIALKKIIAKFPALKLIGSDSIDIASIKSINDDIGTNDIIWVSDKNSEQIKTIHQGVIICSNNVPRTYFNPNCAFIIVKNPRLYFLEVVREFFNERTEPRISSRAIIHESVSLGRNNNIEDNVVIEEGTVIGDKCAIGANTVIKRNTIIGNNVSIGCNNTIGGVGFGYERDESGAFVLIPHIGNVVIDDNVEIGNNTAIDRAVLGSTVIRKNAKIDNLVHIAHGATIGENSLIIANAMIAGSTQIGKNVWVAPSSSVLNKVIVNDDVTIGMGAVVIRDVEKGKTIVGNPGKVLEKKKS